MAEKYGAIRSAEVLERFVDKLIKENKPVGFDIESGYVGPDRKDLAKWEHHPDWLLVGVSFTNSTKWARYVPVAHDGGDNVDDVPRAAKAFWRLLNHLDDNGKALGVAHNLPFELTGLSIWFMQTLADDPEVGEAVRTSKGFFPFRSDTMIEAFEVAAYMPKSMPGGVGIGLKELTKHIFGHQMIEFMDLFPPEDGPDGPGTPKNKTTTVRFNTRELSEKVIEYCCEDSVWCLALHEKHYPMPEITNTDGSETVIHKTEMMLIPVTVQMEFEGMLLNWDLIEEKANEIKTFQAFMNEEILAELSERLGEVININLNSTDQLAMVLYDKMGLPIKKRSKKTQKPSTDEEALRAIAKADPMVNAILDYKQVIKLYGSYLNKYRTELHYDKSGRAHPNHNQVGALTGRFSVDHVSYQQWPKPYHYELKSGREFDFNFRDLFIAPPDHRVMGYDFSQVELRFLSGMAQETAMLQAFASGTDIHKATAAAMFNIPVSDVTKDLRAKGKTGNFAVVYGSGAQNMADMMGSTKEEAEDLLKKYYEGFPNLRTWMDKMMATGSEQGYVETIFKRKFTVWEYQSKFPSVRNKGDRMCINAPVQGGAADYMKIGMIRVTKAIKKAEESGLIPVGSIRLILTVHDALEFYVHNDVASQTVIDIVTPAVSFPVKGLPQIRTDWHEGPRWGTAPEIELDDNGKIVKYSHTVELDDGSAVHWEDESLVVVLAQYAAWESEYFGEKAKKTASLPTQAPEIVKPKPGAKKKPVADPEFDAIVAPILNPEEAPKEDFGLEAEATEEEPPWLHGAEWHAEHDTPMALMEEEPQRAIVTITEMPDEDQWAAFEDYLEKQPGTMTVVVSTPEGDIEMDTKHSLSNEDQPKLSLILGGATVALGAESVRADELIGSLDL